MTNDISILSLFLFSLLLALPVALSLKMKLRMHKEIVVGAISMSAQLFLVGLYLKVIFQLNNPFLTTAWFAIMLLASNISIVKKSYLNFKSMFIPVFVGNAISSISVLIIFMLLLVRQDPLYDARYLIPIGGMILGNCLSGNILALERFYSLLSKNKEVYLSYRSMGATNNEAILPFASEAIKASLGPMSARMMTIGIVSLPGMMTGQIIGGVVPLVAIKYQIAIMFAIFVSLSMSVYINIFFSAKFAFDEFGLKENIIRTD